jgi:hypothetical protein
MSNLKAMLLAVAILVCVSCASVSSLAETVLFAGEYVIEDAGEFLSNPDHQKVVIELGLDVVSGSKITAVDIVSHCAVAGCHAITL